MNEKAEPSPLRRDQTDLAAKIADRLLDESQPHAAALHLLARLQGLDILNTFSWARNAGAIIAHGKTQHLAGILDLGPPAG